jgi:hypothetical protein
MKKSKNSKTRLYFNDPPSQSAETRRLFLDFVLSRISQITIIVIYFVVLGKTLIQLYLTIVHFQEQK